MNATQQARRKLTRKAFRAMLDLPNTQAETNDIARKHKRKHATIKETAALIDAAADEIRRARVTAKPRAMRRRLPRENNVARNFGRYKAEIRSTTLQERLIKHRYFHVQSAVQESLRQYARQESPKVHVVDDFNASGVHLDKAEGWIDYKRAGRWRGVTDATYTVDIHRGWLCLPRWLQTCDGMLTVAAIRQQDDEQPGETVYRARWTRNSTGDVFTQSGYIVRLERDGRTYTAHGKTLGGARGSIARQLPEYLAAETARQQQRAKRIESIKAKIARTLEAGRLNGYDVTVTLSDSTRAGNCPQGSRHWIAKHFPDQDSASVSEILSVDDQHDRALLACVAAIRRQKPEVFKS